MLRYTSTLWYPQKRPTFELSWNWANGFRDGRMSSYPALLVVGIGKFRCARTLSKSRSDSSALLDPKFVSVAEQLSSIRLKQANYAKGSPSINSSSCKSSVGNTPLRSIWSVELIRSFSYFPIPVCADGLRVPSSSSSVFVRGACRRGKYIDCFLFILLAVGRVILMCDSRKN